ncbi:MAG: hypothetical protein IJ079_04530 [Lachnospiraceae bacterium]|nr:hypothetical protein [Lachnospiraceae bacterium]
MAKKKNNKNNGSKQNQNKNNTPNTVKKEQVETAAKKAEEIKEKTEATEKKAEETKEKAEAAAKKAEEKVETAKKTAEETKVTTAKEAAKLEKQALAEGRKQKKKIKRPMTPARKLFLSVLGLAACILVIYLVYYLIHYVSYNKYKDYLTTYEYENGTTYSPMADSGASVAGYELVAESDSLKLYTDTKTANIAILDKRNGEITYSNPSNIENDTVANAVNQAYLRSQMLVYYYNADVVSGTMCTFTDSVAKGQYTWEGIQNGIRYIYEVGDKAGIYFSIPLEYRLQDDNLEVSIPVKEIEEYGGGAVYRIQMLRYLGATSYADNGYMVVPNGSGSLINFNNGKSGMGNYSQYIYDIDPLAANYTTVELLETAKLPIYGICKDKSSILVSVEDGASTAVITAVVSGTDSDYNYVYPSFVLRIVDNLRMFGDATQDVFVMEPTAYQVNLRTRYTFLTEENTGYAGLANYYRNRLVEEGILTAKNETGDIPFYYDVIASVKENAHFLGVQYLHAFSMTDFDEAETISNSLKDQGIENQVVNLQGWFNGGYYHDAADHINVLAKLGGKSGLEDLNQTIVDNGGRMYVDTSFQQVTFADDTFPYNQEGARYYGAGYVATFGQINPTTLRNTSGLGYDSNRYNLISPKFLPRYVDAFSKRINRYDVYGISLRDLGNVLTSDKKRTNQINREEALDVVLGQFDTLEATGKALMTTDANSYAFAYSSDIINTPLAGSQVAITDTDIPLYQMVLHGYIDYSSDLLNFESSDNMPAMTLKLIESGASPHYVFTWEESSEMKLTALNRFYTTTYANWEQAAVEEYNTVNEALAPVSGSAIVGHEILDNNVRKVTYDNGMIIYVNYSNEACTVDGVEIPAMGYRLEGK